MTAIEHRMARVTPAAVPTTTLRWEISPSAIRRAPLPEVAAMNGQAEKISAARLEWLVEDDKAAARLVLEIGEDDVVISLGDEAGSWIIDPATGMRHGVFGEQLTVSMRGDELMYARTRVFERALALQGGVYVGPRVH